MQAADHHPDADRGEEQARIGQPGRDRRDRDAEGRGRVGAEGIEAAMRDVDDAHDAEDQAQPDRDQEHQSGVGDAVERREDGELCSCEAFGEARPPGPPGGGDRAVTA